MISKPTTSAKYSLFFSVNQSSAEFCCRIVTGSSRFTDFATGFLNCLRTVGNRARNSRIQKLEQEKLRRARQNRVFGKRVWGISRKCFGIVPRKARVHVPAGENEKVVSLISIENPLSFPQNVGFRTTGRSGLSASSSSLVLDSERGELVKAPAKLLQKGIAEAKAKAALKSHSEAERRRRERINAHLTTLRTLVPSNDKMDKATLLAEVISRVKELKGQASEASKGYAIPTDVDDVRVEADGAEADGGSFSLQASLCCEDRPELFSDLKQSLQALNPQVVRAEMSTLGGRMKSVFALRFEGSANDNQRRIFANSVHQALKSVLDRGAAAEFSPRTSLPNKRRRISLFDSFSSSS
ncbi:hypothetical protein ACLOJK_010517 [Asimina triloba]